MTMAFGEGCWLEQYFYGWRSGISLCGGAAFTVLAVNITLVISASTHYGVFGGFGTIMDGSCEKTKNLSLWLHFAINALSTILLGASNYCMQCLSSPTRLEIDKAHSQGICLDIGVSSIRNLRRISRGRHLLWWLLAVSSIPLHLMYNSAIFTTLATQSYRVYIGPSDSLDGPLQRFNSAHQDNLHSIYETFSISTIERLDNAKCIKAYAESFVAARSDVIAVSSTVVKGQDLQELYQTVDTCGRTVPYCWICNGGFHEGCDTGPILSNSSSWTLIGLAWTNSTYPIATPGKPLTTKSETRIPVDYCLSKRVKERCKVQFSLHVMIVVIISNLLKAVSMLLILWTQKSAPLVTLGDAIVSFLEVPDRFPGKHHHPNNHNGLWLQNMSFRRWFFCNLL